ncbi:MAG: DUF3365 domain-containing protein [Nitrospirae bacterium]|nr:DUF3365 domain-containing protein [Nitrospirota bacterium]
MLYRITAALLPRVFWLSILTMAGWTALIAASLYGAIERHHAETLENAAVEARSIYYLNKEYRSWVSDRGGVYVRVTDDFRPNPYLKLPKRDVTTTDGTQLTLVNPAYMTRLVFEYVGKRSSPPIINRLVSTKYVNPLNAPDGWERENLELFETGSVEASKVVTIGGEPYLRYMKPFLTEDGCLKCHGSQGYNTGDVRGGISLSIPLKPFLDAEARLRDSAIKRYFVIWFIGIGIISFYSIGITAATRRRIAQKEAKLSSMRQMMVGMAHHWRQPMNRIGLTLQGLDSASRDGGIDVRYIDNSVRRAMSELNAMSADISLFNATFRPAGAAGSAAAKVPLRAVFGDAMLLLQENGITPTLSCRGGVFARQCLDEPVSGDGRMLETVINTLAVNSVNAIKERIIRGELPPGGGVVDIECTMRRKRLRLRMTDNGGGIPAEVMDRLFEPYFTTKDKSVHSGTGLFVAKTIVEQYYDGSIRVRNSGDSAEILLEVMIDDE